MSEQTVFLDKVDHSYIRYANVWEDTRLLLEGLQCVEGCRIISIASAGDNALALLSTKPEVVVAADINKPQLYLTELKKVAIKHLDHFSFLAFIGFTSSNNRNKIFDSIKRNLTSECRGYWENSVEVINKGIIYQGKFEGYLSMFARKIIPLIHSDRKSKELLRTKPEDEQANFYSKDWNTWRWKLLFRLFFSRRIMGLIGRDPAFLKEVEGNVGKLIIKQVEKHVASVYAQTNPYLYYCLNGNFGDYLPFYASEANYSKIRENIDALDLEFGYIQEVGKKYGQFDAFNLSNIFEYMSKAVFADTTKSLINLTTANARFAYWNLMVDRDMSKIDQRLVNVEDTQNWNLRDYGFFYKKFFVNEMK